MKNWINIMLLVKQTKISKTDRLVEEVSMGKPKNHNVPNFRTLTHVIDVSPCEDTHVSMFAEYFLWRSALDSIEVRNCHNATATGPTDIP